MTISIDLHVKCPFYKKWNKKKLPIFLLWNFHTVFGEQKAIFYQLLSQGALRQGWILFRKAAISSGNNFTYLRFGEGFEVMDKKKN